MSNYPETPELDKRSEVLDEGNKIGEFLDWLVHEKGITLAEWDERDRLMPANTGGFERLLADYFGIDLDKVEAEKLAILKHLRASQDS
jgi:hypothetical protein